MNRDGGTERNGTAGPTDGGIDSYYELRDNFFESRAIKKIRAIAGGDTYTIIYLRLLVLASENDGWIYSEGIGNMTEEMALELNETKETVSAALTILEGIGLVQTVSDTKLFLRNCRTAPEKEIDTEPE